jgi:hypothetical protein
LDWRSLPRLHPVSNRKALHAWKPEMHHLTKRILMAFELAAKPSPYSPRQGVESLTPDTSAPADDSVESNTRRLTGEAVVARTQADKRRLSFHATLATSPDSFVAGNSPANSRKGCRLDWKPYHPSIFLDYGLSLACRAKPLVVEPLQRHTIFATPSAWRWSTQRCPNRSAEAATAPPDIQQTHQDGAFQSDDLLSEVEFELIWLGKKVCTAWCVLNFNLTSSTNMRHLH